MIHNISNLQKDVTGFYGDFYIVFNRLGNVSIWYRDEIIAIDGAVYNSLNKTNKNIFDRLIRNYVSKYLDSNLNTFDGKKFIDKIGAY